MLLKDPEGLRETYLLIESIESIGSENTCRYRECIMIHGHPHDGQLFVE
jgi:hypothetical protein